MSFPFRSNLFSNGSYYCDWRIWAHDCEDSEFFFNTLVVNAFFHVFCAVGFYGVVAFKVSQSPPCSSALPLSFPTSSFPFPSFVVPELFSFLFLDFRSG